jgi:predicted Zn finger-like uncharacterized protein
VNVACPECRSVFRVDPAKVPFGGVRARCSACGGVIPVPSGPDELRTAPDAAPSAVAPSLIAPVALSSPPRPPAVVAAAVLAPAVSAPAVAAPAVAPSAPAPLRPTVAQVVPPTEDRATAAGPVLRPTAAWRASALTSSPPQPPVVAAPAVGGSSVAPPGPVAPRTTPWPTMVPVVPPAVPPAVPTAAAPVAPPTVPVVPAAVPSVVPAGQPTPPAFPRRHVNPFLSADPQMRARRLARALVSDMIAYLPQKREEGLRNGTLQELFKEEIGKSYEEYVEQIGRELAESTTHFRDALNDLLAGGQRLF